MGCGRLPHIGQQPVLHAADQGELDEALLFARHRGGGRCSWVHRFGATTPRRSACAGSAFQGAGVDIRAARADCDAALPPHGRTEIVTAARGSHRLPVALERLPICRADPGRSGINETAFKRARRHPDKQRSSQSSLGSIPPSCCIAAPTRSSRGPRTRRLQRGGSWWREGRCLGTTGRA